MDSLRAFAPEIQPEVDPVSEADRQWWARLARDSEWWHDLAAETAAETVADAYGDPWASRPSDDEAIDRRLANHGYEPTPLD